MNNEMISQLQFDRIKKEIQARAIGNYSKKRISNMTASTNLQTVLDRQEETREAPSDDGASFMDYIFYREHNLVR